MSETYREPVARLLTLGHPHRGNQAPSEWLDYPGLGLAAEHVPELARMALDQDLHEADAESAEVWAPLHAWRALGQLRAESAVEPLLQLLDRIDEYGNDWAQEDLPQVFGLIGPAAMPGLRGFLADAKQGEWARIAAGGGLAAIVERFPESREEAAGILTDQLRHFGEQERTVNAYLVSLLCDLKAVESAAVIEQAFAAGAVDLSVQGDWEEAQIRLGLIDKRSTPAPNFFEAEFGLHLPSGGPPLPGRQRVGHPAGRQSDKQKKAKRKQAKAARKRNRKR